MPIHVFDSLPEMERAEMVIQIRLEELLSSHGSHIVRKIADEKTKDHAPTRPGTDPYAVYG